MVRLVVMVLSVMLCQSAHAFMDSIESIFDNGLIEMELNLNNGPLIINEGELSSLFIARSYLFPKVYNADMISKKDSVFDDITQLGKEAGKVEIIGYMSDTNDMIDRFNLIDQLSKLQKTVYEILGDYRHTGSSKLVMISSVVSDYSGSIKSNGDQIEVRFYPEWKLGEYR